MNNIWRKKKKEKPNDPFKKKIQMTLTGTPSLYLESRFYLSVNCTRPI